MITLEVMKLSRSIARAVNILGLMVITIISGSVLKAKRYDRIWMTLTGQVFPLMSGLANEDEISAVIRKCPEILKR